MPAAMIGIGMVAIAGASIYGSIRNSQEAEAAANSAAAAQKKRDEAYAEATKLAKEQYERWEQDFGEIQTEVADYYKNLSDDILKQQYEDANTQANQSLVQQYFAAQSNIKSSMNKAGMAGSGAEQSSTLQLQQTALAQKAQNRWQTQQLKANANNVLMGQKANWAQQGENLRSQAMQNQYNAEAMKGNSAAADYQMYEQMRAQYTQNAINSVTNGLASMGGMMMGVGGQMYTADKINSGLNNIAASMRQNLTLSSPIYGATSGAMSVAAPATAGFASGYSSMTNSAIKTAIGSLSQNTTKMYQQNNLLDSFTDYGIDPNPFTVGGR